MMILFRCFAMVFIILSTLKNLRAGRGDKEKDGSLGTCECGISHVDYSKGKPRILNGSDVEPPDKYPWIVQLTIPFIEVGGDSGRKCAGCIIRPRVILTAAHCQQKPIMDCIEKNYTSDDCFFEPDRIKVGLVNKNTETVIHSSVIKVIRHENYSLYKQIKAPADISLLFLKDPIPCTDSTRPICLPERSMAKTGMKTIISGWGSISTENHGSSERLQEGVMEIRHHKDCQDEQKNEPPDLQFSMKDLEGTICSGKYEGQGAFYGDSGSPTFIKASEVFYHLGIASTGLSEDMQKDTSHILFTDTHFYRDWIMENLPKEG